MPEWVCTMALNAKTKEKIMMMAPNVKQIVALNAKTKKRKYSRCMSWYEK